MVELQLCYGKVMEDMWDIQATKEVRKMRAMKDMRHRKDMWEVYGAKA